MTKSLPTVGFNLLHENFQISIQIEWNTVKIEYPYRYILMIFTQSGIDDFSDNPVHTCKWTDVYDTVTTGMIEGDRISGT